MLLWLFLIPLFASGLVALGGAKCKSQLKKIAFFMSLLPLFYLLLGGTEWIGQEINYPWFSVVSIHFHLHVDALSFVFVALTVFLIPITILLVQTPREEEKPFFYALVLFLEMLLIGFFTAKDLALFTIFWEAMLLPLYFIIALWGGGQRQQVALKFLVYMFAGSLLMVAALLGLYFSPGGGTFDLSRLSQIAGSLPHAELFFLIFLFAFAVKAPLFPFHGWLPDTYFQAPMAGTMLLSGLLSKAGIYAILRVGIELFPLQMQAFSIPLISLAIVGVFYGGLAAWRENDYKRLIAYSSFSHINFILVGLFVWSETAHSGAILQAFNHGVTITALFLVAGWLEERIKTTAIGQVGGLAKFMPHLCWLTLFFVLSSVALPGTNNFVGEFIILFALFKSSPIAAIILCMSVVLSVTYMLRWMQKVYFEQPGFFQESFVDIKYPQYLLALPLVLLVLWVGIYPAPLIELTTRASKFVLVK